MAKRFIDTNRWRDKWFRSLKAGEKLVYLYLVDNCDIAGFIQYDLEEMEFYLKVDEAKLKSAMEGLVSPKLAPRQPLILAQDVIWIPWFIKEQKNLPLNPDNNAHKGIITILKRAEQPLGVGTHGSNV